MTARVSQRPAGAGRSRPARGRTGAAQAHTRATILKLALRRYTEAGYASVSLRELARRLGFSVQAIYHYFPSKRAIFAALADEGLRLLELQHPPEELPDPLDNLRLPYLRYYNFSKAHNGYFRLLWMDPAAAAVQQEPQVILIRRLADDTYRRLRRCIDEGILPATLDFRSAAELLLASVHGPAVIGLTGQPSISGDLDQIAVRLLDAAILELRSERVIGVGVQETVSTAPARR